MRKALGILSGNAILAFGIVAFVLPNNFLVGGTTGVGRVIFNLAEFPISYTIGIINVIMFVTGLIILGKRFALNTLLSTILFPVFIDFFQRIEGINEITDNKLIAMIYAGVLTGVSLGLVIRTGGSTGGFDIPPIIINKYLGTPIAVSLYALDVGVLLIQVPFSNAEDILYSIIISILTAYTLDQVLLIGKGDIQFIIISKKYEEINKAINDELDMGSTMFMSKTGHLEEEIETVYCVAPKRAINTVKQRVQGIDPEAFMTINSVREVRGRGFSYERLITGDDKKAN